MVVSQTFESWKGRQEKTIHLAKKDAALDMRESKVDARESKVDAKN